MDFDVLPSSVSPVASEPLLPLISPQQLKQILSDTALLEQLSDRVYTLIKHDLKQQRERSQGYGRRF